MNNPIRNVSGNSSVVTHVNNTPHVVTKAATKSQTKLSPAYTVEISEESRIKATQSRRTEVSKESLSEAKEQLAQVKETLKTSPQKVKRVHSNLSIMRINHLIFE